MHLLIDVGNTRAKWSLVDNIDDAFVTHYGSLEELSEYIETIQVASIDVLLAAVNQTVDLISIIQRAGFQSVRIIKTQKEQAGVINSYEQPERMGIDRWLAMIATYGFHRKKDDNGMGYVIVDAGSAMTIDVLTSEGVHQGGYIVPGLTMSQMALFANTEKVNRYDEDTNTDDMKNGLLPLGKNTVQCVEYGIINQMVALIKSVLDEYENYKLIITGGDGELLARFFNDSIVDKDLVLKGLWQVRN